MTAYAPIDIEDALREALDSESCRCYAPPIPDNLSTLIPCARIRRVGGTKNGLVIDQSNVVVDVWATTDAEAMAQANRLAGEATALQYTHPAITQVSITTLPYQSNDPSHPTLCRAAFMLSAHSVSERS